MCRKPGKVGKVRACLMDVCTPLLDVDSDNNHDHTNVLTQGFPKSGPWAKCGPWSNFIRPAPSVTEYLSKKIEIGK